MKRKRVLTLKDRIQALQRSKQYRQDFQEYEQYCRKNHVKDTYLIDLLCPTPLSALSEAAQSLCKKYGLPFPIDPDGTAISLPDETRHPIKDAIDLPAVIPLPLEKGKSIFGLQSGRYLNVLIDLERTEGEIFKAIKELYDFYYQQIKEGQRQRPTELDPWLIFDQIESEGKNRLQITKEITGTDENPTYNSYVDAVYKQVNNAYRKAKDILKAFEN